MTLATSQNAHHLVWDIDPILFSLGPLRVHWYGVLFAMGFLLGYQLMVWIYRQESKPIADLESLFVHMFLGTVIGARLGHCFFYYPEYYISNPLEVLYIWNGGLASHGGAIGIFIALYIYSRKHADQPYLWLLSRMSILVPQGGAFIRFGNFINSEILGTPSSVPWAVIFKRVDMIPRHPAMLYESIAYALIFVLMFCLYLRTRKNTSPELLLGTFLVSIFGCRFFIEFVKETHATFEKGLVLHMGQILSIPLIVIGITLSAATLLRNKK